MPEISEVVDTMVQIRDRMDERRKDFEAAQKKDRERWEKGESWLLSTMDEQGLPNIGTESHTVFSNDQMMASVGDHQSLRDHILGTGEIDLLERRVSSKAVKTYLDENGGELPPGVKVYTKRKINIRKKG